jgi:hypothetical protein
MIESLIQSNIKGGQTKEKWEMGKAKSYLAEGKFGKQPDMSAFFTCTMKTRH